MDPTDPLGSRALNARMDTYRGLADVSVADYDIHMPLEDLSFNPVEHHERMALGTLRSDAGREYDSDEFSRRTLRRITQDLRHDGHRPGGIIVPDLSLFDGDRLASEGECTAVTGVNFHGWSVAPVETEGVLDGEAFVFGEAALTRPEHAPAQILVRHPDGVARYVFGGDG